MDFPWIEQRCTFAAMKPDLVPKQTAAVVFVKLPAN